MSVGQVFLRRRPEQEHAQSERIRELYADPIGVPYSEHSSFFELSCFALSMPGPDLRMIATVNVGNEKR